LNRKFTELLALQLKPADFMASKREKVGAPRWGTTHVLLAGLAGPQWGMIKWCPFFVGAKPREIGEEK
jgi:hypothetical protein